MESQGFLTFRTIEWFLRTIGTNTKWGPMLTHITHLAKIDLNKKWLPKQKTVQNFNIDAQGFRKTRNENPPTQKIGVTS